MSGGDLDGYPRLKPIHFLEYMAECNQLKRLTGGKPIESSADMLRGFWHRFEKCHPDFALFTCDEYKHIDRGDCIPILCHADGGRGFKKAEFLVFNWSGVLGAGTGKSNKKDPSVRAFKRKRMQINLLGHSYGTHYMWAVMPASWHKKDEVFEAMMKQFGQDLHECFSTGIMVGNRHLRLVNIGLQADLKFQAKAAKLSRWYSTCRKGPIDANNKNQTLGQCCWLCPAGDVDYPFEDFSESPDWYEVMDDFADVPPWQGLGLPELLNESIQYTSQPAKFLLPDLFHIYLAGFGQDHAASCLVAMMGPIFGGDSVESQFQCLNSAFRMWKRMHHVTTHTYSFNRNMLNFLDYKRSFPTGTWSKASDTAKIMNFIDFVCDLYSEVLETDKVLYYIKASVHALGISMRGLYEADLWIETCQQNQVFFVFKAIHLPCFLILLLYGPIYLSATAAQDKTLASRIVDSGLHFLKCYAKLATLSHKDWDRPLFVYRPKMHYYHHILLQMKQVIAKGEKPLNPLSYSCSQAEDFIGRASLLSRRVASGSTQTRVLQRYLAGAFQVWHKDQSSSGWPGPQAQKRQRRWGCWPQTRGSEMGEVGDYQ